MNVWCASALKFQLPDVAGWFAPFTLESFAPNTMCRFTLAPSGATHFHPPRRIPDRPQNHSALVAVPSHLQRHHTVVSYQGRASDGPPCRPTGRQARPGKVRHRRVHHRRLLCKPRRTCRWIDDSSDDDDDDSRASRHLRLPDKRTRSYLVTPSARAYGSQVRFYPLPIRHAVRLRALNPQMRPVRPA